MSVYIRPTGRAKKVVDAFPAFMRLDEPGKALGSIAIALGGDADKAEARLGGILAARRVRQARQESELFALAASLGLVPEDFLLLQRGYDAGLYQPPPGEELEEPVPDEEAEGEALAEYQAYLDDLRASIERCAKVMLEGCGTLWALMEGASLILGAENAGWDSVEHPDEDLPVGGFLHRVRIHFQELTAEGWEPRENWLYLQENPLLDKEAGPFEARQRKNYQAKRGGFYHGKCDVVIEGSEDRTVKPRVINRRTREGHGFRGVLADGQELRFSRDGKVYLDGMDVTQQAYHFHGGLHDDLQKTRFQPGEPEDLGFVTPIPEGSMDRNFPRPAVVGLEELPAPRLLLGDNVWRFSVEEGAFDASAFDECVFAFPKSEEAIAALPPSGKLTVHWREHKAFSVKLLLPPELQTWEAPLLDGDSLPELVRRGLEKFRAAGIELEVTYWNEDWILGQSVLEDAEEPMGPGVDFDAPTL